MAEQAGAFARSYNSFSGVDIKGVFNNKVVAELQAISYSVTREKAPIYTMGSADPRSFSRGKRGIAGTLIFIMFDRHALIETMKETQFLSDVDDIRPSQVASKDLTSAALLARGAGSTAGEIGATIENQESDLSAIDSDQAASSPWFSDQIPPFDITLAAANEYGALAVMRIFGCEILNEGYGVSIDDIVSEQQNTYVARTLTPWKSLGKATGF